MKHKTLWTFMLWVVILSIFEMPLLLLPIEKFIKINNFVFIVLIDLYVIASLFALSLAKCGVKTMDKLIATIKDSSK